MPRPSQIPNARAIFRRLEQVAYEQLVEDVREWAFEVRDDFVALLESQSFASFQRILYPESGTNLSPEWLKTKERAGADLRTMIATGHYVDSIEVFTDEDPANRKTKIRVGFHPSADARDLDGRKVEIQIPGTSITGLTALAIVHELGSVTANVPARPHWRPHRVKVRESAKKLRPQLRRNIARRLASDNRLRGLAVKVR